MKPAQKTIRTDDREVLIVYLRRQGKKVSLAADNETVAREFSKIYREPMPPLGVERMTFLVRVLADVRAEIVEKRAVSSNVPAFRPLKITLEMQRAIQRAKELYS